jgi:hypothetical protein
VKLMVMIGAILGADSLPYIVCVSALLSTLAGLGLVLAGGGRGGEWRTTRIPCGPFPAAGALLYLLAQGQIPRFFGWIRTSRTPAAAARSGLPEQSPQKSSSPRAAITRSWSPSAISG